MSKIIIREEDLTRNLGNAVTSTDIVFIPGFMGNNGTGSSPAGKLEECTLCKTLSEFQYNFGTIPAQFASAQPYPVLPSAIPESSTYGYEAEAIPPAVQSVVPPMFPANSSDPSYVMASELLLAGIPVLYYAIDGTSPSVLNMFVKLNEIFTLESSPLVLNEVDVKYITAGGYPVYELGYWGSAVGTLCQYNILVDKMTILAEERADAVAIFDHTNNPSRALIGTGSVYAKANGDRLLAVGQDQFGVMFTPWGNYGLSRTYPGAPRNIGFEFGASFAYLLSLAKSLKTNPNWYAVAGASRGLVPRLDHLLTDKTLTNAIANKYQEETDGTCCINPITNIKPYGLCIWGNRTMKKNDSAAEGYAASFLNIRSLICDVKKQAHMAAQSLMFEQNNDVLWINFKAMMTPLLDRMLSGNGVSSYKIIKVETDSQIKLAAQIKIWPIYAVEEFEIGIQITDEEVTVA